MKKTILKEVFVHDENKYLLFYFRYIILTWNAIFISYE